MSASQFSVESRTRPSSLPEEPLLFAMLPCQTAKIVLVVIPDFD